MKRFIRGSDRAQGILLPEQLDEYVTDENPVRVIDIFVDEMDLATLGFEGVTPAGTGRPAFHPANLLKLYIYGRTDGDRDRVSGVPLSARTQQRQHYCCHDQ